jgi:thiosulfate/3-mercaptopyruvate sulfurtransferase
MDPLPASLARPLVSAPALLAEPGGDPARGPRLVDCRFRLDDPGAGELAWRRERLPGAPYLHLDRDLSGPIVPGRTGRHPLPEREALRERFRLRGIARDRPVVFYDDAGGPFAARAWWLACLAGHPDAHVLDGGLDGWRAAGGALETGAPSAPVAAPPWPDAPPLVTAVDADTVLAALRAPETVLVDARARPRFEGREEPIDPVAGHIPGARCLPFDGNLGPDRRFLSPEALHDRWASVLGPDPAAAICYCGSGVTAAHDVLAVVAAGLPPPRLYAGSWSEWITDPARPVARGPEAPAGP